jgi:hypothetical protein
MNIDEMIAVLEAYKRGEVIEVTCIDDDKNLGFMEDSCPSWDFFQSKYRVKVEDAE